MNLHPTWRNRLLITIGALLAVILAAQIASGDLFLAILTAGGFAVFIFSRVTKARLEAYVMAAIFIGYAAGNRGFAQASLLKTFPLFPAELSLAIAVTLLLMRGTVQRRWPFTGDRLSLAVLFWMVLSSLRFPIDLRQNGLFALRDFALVYYASFFLIVMEAARDPASFRVLTGGVTAGLALLAPCFLLSYLYPEFFWTYLTYNGIPLILHKPDLSSAMCVVGLSWFYIYTRRRDWMAWWGKLFFIVNVGVIGFAVGRATMLALACTTLFWVLAREWRFIAALVILGVVGVMGSIGLALVEHSDVTQTKAYSLYEHTISIADWSGQRTYQNLETSDSTDNNQFRLVWWRIVGVETLQKSPLIGLGWGYDLGEIFAHEYFGLASEDFSARSPHNVLLTVFGHTGLVGLVGFLVIIACMVLQTAQALHQHHQAGDAGRALALWAGAWAMLISACFGVVLEGPMGAVVFWIILGLANASTLAKPTEEVKHESSAIAAEALHETAEKI